ncbi:MULTISPECIES: SIMPL domain-containing protein [Aphanothece]|uniref:SIMPL domain-containing protein n=1 Tax=Aphanothece TaxID=1121 RepID=UPI0039855394
MRRCLPLLLPSLILWLPMAAGAQVQLQCSGTVVDARGNAEVRRTASRFRFSLGLEAEGAAADPALEELQRRLAAVRTRLKALDVQKLEVGSPSTWQRGRRGRQPEVTVASLQVSGMLAMPQLQALVRQVGGLPGVRLSPVQPEAESSGDEAIRRRLLREAYKDALDQGRELAAVLGRDRVVPLQVQVEGGMRPTPLRAMAADEQVPPFDPRELPQPVERLSLQVWFCAQ